MKVIFEDNFQKISFRIHNLPFRNVTSLGQKCLPLNEYVSHIYMYTYIYIYIYKHIYISYCHVVVTSLGIRNKNHRCIISNTALYWLVTSLGKKFIDEFTIVKACSHELASSLQNCIGKVHRWMFMCMHWEMLLTSTNTFIAEQKWWPRARAPLQRPHPYAYGSQVSICFVTCTSLGGKKSSLNPTVG